MNYKPLLLKRKNDTKRCSKHVKHSSRLIKLPEPRNILDSSSRGENISNKLGKMVTFNNYLIINTIFTYVFTLSCNEDQAKGSVINKA